MIDNVLPTVPDGFYIQPRRRFCVESREIIMVRDGLLTMERPTISGAIITEPAPSRRQDVAEFLEYTLPVPADNKTMQTRCHVMIERCDNVD